MNRGHCMFITTEERLSTIPPSLSKKHKASNPKFMGSPERLSTALVECSLSSDLMMKSDDQVGNIRYRNLGRRGKGKYLEPRPCIGPGSRGGGCTRMVKTKSKTIRMCRECHLIIENMG